MMDRADSFRNAAGRPAGKPAPHAIHDTRYPGPVFNHAARRRTPGPSVRPETERPCSALAEVTVDFRGPCLLRVTPR